tara:strand:+ start:507 stop:668 length:162 start_codon:yes stop_codon:yes gene_type:complete
MERIFFAAVGGFMLLVCVVKLWAEGFPSGGVEFYAAVASFIIAGRSDGMGGRA